MSNFITIKFSILMMIVLISCKDRGSPPTYITIGTGSKTGLYYPIGGVIARMLNKKVDEYRIKASAKTSSGSKENINALIKGNIQFAIVQSDQQYHAYHGKGDWEKTGPVKKLRSICSIHFENITLIADVQSKIDSIYDLRGKKVNLGHVSSGNLDNALDILHAFNLQEKDMTASFFEVSKAYDLLKNGQLDAYFYTIGHPNTNIINISSLNDRKVKIIPIEGAGIDQLVAQHPYYVKSKIPIEFYPRAANKTDIPTIGVKATLITTSDVDSKIVYAITKEIFGNFAKFKELHPAYKFLKKSDMIKDALTAPMHEGTLLLLSERKTDLDQDM